MLGSYVIFTLNGEEYGIDILKSQEILQVKEIVISKVPTVPKFISGIINLRGEVILIMSLKKRFDFSKAMEDEKRVIIVEDKKLVVGFLVDFIVEVLHVSEEEMISPPEDIKLRYEYVDSIIYKEKRMIFILNINKIIERRTEI
jgi:purine-binding chemotaxis protein CheW